MSDESAPRISFIVPALNEAACIRRAVETAIAAGAWEVIVADGGSDDKTAQIASGAGARVIESPPGRARQQNAGAKAAGGDVLLFQHADNWCDPATGEQVRAALTDVNVQGGAFRQRIEADGILFRWLERGNAARVRFRKMAYGDQGIFLRRTFFEELGRFPEVPLMEDLLLMQQFRRRSRPVLLDGPHHVSARRWQRHGVIRQTLRNWRILLAHRMGTSPEELARWYRRHDQQ